MEISLMEESHRSQEDRGQEPEGSHMGHRTPMHCRSSPDHPIWAIVLPAIHLTFPSAPGRPSRAEVMRFLLDLVPGLAQ